jgi:EPS-associated MarR family transcriptional regulator
MSGPLACQPGKFSLTFYCLWFRNRACSRVEHGGESLLPTPELSQLDNEDVLKILKAIKDDPALTQRELSSRLGISLGKVNYLIKSLIRRGLVKVDNFKSSSNKISYLYKLTPSGIEEKARTTFFFLKRKLEEYERLEMEIGELRQEISTIEVQKENPASKDIRQ